MRLLKLEVSRKYHAIILELPLKRERSRRLSKFSTSVGVLVLMVTFINILSNVALAGDRLSNDSSQPACDPEDFNSTNRQVFGVDWIENQTPIDAWLAWEQEAVERPYRQSANQVEIPFRWINKSKVHFDAMSLVPTDLESLITGHPWKTPGFIHPFNQSPNVAFKTDAKTDGTMRGRLMGSSSLFFSTRQNHFALNVATDQPFGLRNRKDTKSLNIEPRLSSGLRRSRMIDRTDALIEPCPELVIVRDVMTVSQKLEGSEKESVGGYSIEDYSFLRSGDYYLPAFSVPFVGPQIAEKFGKSFSEFWGVAFAKSVGRAKAQLLLRYGIELRKPDLGNFLLELDKDLRLTGKVVVRGIFDSSYIDFVAVPYSLQADIIEDLQNGGRIRSIITPNWEFTSERLASTLDSETIEKWGIQHDLGFAEELITELRLPRWRFSSLTEILNFLRTTEGQYLLKSFRLGQFMI